MTILVVLELLFVITFLGNDFTKNILFGLLNATKNTEYLSEMNGVEGKILGSRE